MVKISVILALFSASCKSSHQVHLEAPKPDLEFGPVLVINQKNFSGERPVLRLDLTSNVDGLYELSTVAWGTIELTGWRSALEAGFKNGFASKFNVGSGASADFYLELEARPVLDYSNRGYIPAEIPFETRLLDSERRLIRRVRGVKGCGNLPHNGHAFPLFSNIASPNSVKEWFESGIEEMYRHIAWELFKNEKVNTKKGDHR